MGYPNSLINKFLNSPIMAHYNFRKDLLDGHQAELEVIELLARLRPGLTDLERCHTREYDISGIYRGRVVTFEVKYDLKVETTGNIAIEYECRGRPTGIAATEADYWVYKFLGQYFIFRTSELKKKLYEEKVFDRKATGGDLGSNTRMFLVEMEKFKTWGMELKNENENEK